MDSDNELLEFAEQLIEDAMENKGFGFNPNVDYVSLGVNTTAIMAFVGPIEKISEANTNYRTVLFTSKNQQLVVMSVNPNEDLGEEVHEKVDQFFRVEKGSGQVILNRMAADIYEGDSITIPQGTLHNVIAGPSGLKLYTIYSRPNHKYDVIDVTRQDAENREKAEDAEKAKLKTPAEREKKNKETKERMKASVISEISQLIGGLIK